MHVMVADAEVREVRAIMPTSWAAAQSDALSKSAIPIVDKHAKALTKDNRVDGDMGVWPYSAWLTGHC